MLASIRRFWNAATPEPHPTTRRESQPPVATDKDRDRATRAWEEAMKRLHETGA